MRRVKLTCGERGVSGCVSVLIGCVRGWVDRVIKGVLRGRVRGFID